MQDQTNAVTGTQTAVSTSSGTTNGSNGYSNLQERKDKAREEWFQAFLKKLTVWRRVTLTDEIVLGWWLEIQAMGYRYEATTACELWCKFGDWSGQSVDRTLDFQWVFFPTKAQQLQAKENARVQGYVVMTAEEARSAFQYQGAGKVTIETEKPRSEPAKGQKDLSPEWQSVQQSINALFAKHGCA